MKRTSALGALLFTSALVAPGVASAQSVDEADATGKAASGSVDAKSDRKSDRENASNSTNSNEIIVTARRRDERLIDAPVAITAVGGDTLNQYQATRVTDIASLVPSLVAGKAASGSSASIFLRGVGSTALSAGFDQSVSFVIDGLPMSRGREISLPQFDVQRVEVLKGPQALFFGKNTTGGLISITTNGPTDHFEAGLKGGYGFEAKERYVEGFVSGPISDSIRARLAGRYSKSDGAFVNTAAPTYTNYIPGQFRFSNDDRRGGSESYGLRGTVEIDFSPDFKYEVKGGFTKVKDGGPTDLVERLCGGGRTSPLPADPGFGTPFPASPNADCSIDGRSDSSNIPPVVAETNYRYARDGVLYADFASQYVIGTGTISSDVFDVSSITGYYHFKQTDLNNVTGEAYPAGFSQLADFKQFSQELRFQSTFDGPLGVMFGGFYSDSEFVFNTDAYIFPVPLDPINNTFVTFKRDDGFKAKSLSFFAEATLDITPSLELSAGGRYSFESRDSYQRSLAAHSAFATTFPSGIELRDKYNDENFSPQVTLRYKPSTNTTLYASYKQGFKAGGFNISQSLTPAASVQAGRFGAESAEGGEVGFRTLLFDNALAFSITAYRYLYTDLQVQFFDPQTVSLTAGNAGELRTQGIEADFNYRVPGLDGLSLRGAAAYNDAKFRDYIGQCYVGQTIAEGCDLQLVGGAYTAQDYSDRTPPKAPEFAGRLGVTYEMPVGSSFKLRLSGDGSYTSKYNFTDALRPDAVQDGYAKLDAAIAFGDIDDAWTISLIGRNLTNKLVVTAANDMPFTGGTGTGTTTGVVADMSAFVDNPREIIVEASFKF
ncbi:TonB-dependent receptor [Tsuneonella suprasediminis]|uniref:TonB-dependent receptor n=1 Tax=Tsuneonella suprasediminis TaxID=2306996 RepID=UPI002F9565AD